MSRTSEAATEKNSSSGSPALLKTDELKPEGYDGSCLRPTGLCELGGSCDICWYSPDHPRFKNSQD